MSYDEFSNMSGGQFIFVYGGLLIFTIICYCTIPIILRFTLIKKKFLTRGKIIAIAAANSVLIFLIIQILTYDGNGVSLYPTIIWGIVNYLILISGNKKYHNTIKESDDGVIVVGNSTYSYANLNGASKDTVIKPDTLHTEANTQCSFIDNTKTVAEFQNNKRLPKSTKICIGIIAALVVTIGVEGYLVYDLGHYDGYQKGYSVGKDAGYGVGYTKGHADGYRDAE